MTKTRLVLVRHGETVWHADNRYAGAGSDVALTDLGRRQADALAVWATERGVTALVCSPISRAIETARPAAAALGLEPEIVEDLREVDFGVAEGRTIDELRDIDAGMVDRFRHDPVAHPFPGAEQPEEAARRADKALRAVAHRHLGGTVLVVAHNTLLRLALCSLLDIPPSRYRLLFPRLVNAGVTEIDVPDDPSDLAALLTFNAPPVPNPSHTEESR